MVMTYGYITLFASAFPFGTTVTALFIFIEVRSDLFKLEKTARRPFSRKTHDIGTWEFAIDLLTYGSIFTNIVLCCFASNQVDSILPWLKEYKNFSIEAVITTVGLEHFIIAIVLLFKWYWDRTPKWLDVFEERRVHKTLKKKAKKFDSKIQ
jgi:hypothetical protein